MAKNYLNQIGIEFQEINIENNQDAQVFMRDRGHRTVPQIYRDGELFVDGGWQGLSKLTREQIQQRLQPSFDLGTL